MVDYVDRAASERVARARFLDRGLAAEGDDAVVIQNGTCTSFGNRALDLGIDFLVAIEGIIPRDVRNQVGSRMRSFPNGNRRSRRSRAPE